jgi:xanthine dehydrogenase YagS FAD-binding subunit
MKSFAFIHPKTLEDTTKQLGKNWDDSLLYAGGTDLIGMIKHHLVIPQKLVNLKSLQALNNINFLPGKGLQVGALVKVAELAENEIINKQFSVLAQAAKEVASPQLRNMGTVGGNICQRPRCWYFRGDFHCLRKGGDICYAFDGQNKYHCVIGGGPCYIVHPSDLAVALLALDAKVKISSGKKSREIALENFFVLPEDNVLRENILKPGEIVSEIFIPLPPTGSHSSYIKIKERGAWDFAVVSLAAVIEKSGNKIRSARIAYGGVAPIPWMDKELNKKLKGLIVSEESLKNLAKKVFREAEPLEKNAYKILLGQNLLKRILLTIAPE